MTQKTRFMISIKVIIIVIIIIIIIITIIIINNELEGSWFRPH